MALFWMKPVSINNEPRLISSNTRHSIFVFWYQMFNFLLLLISDVRRCFCWFLSNLFHYMQRCRIGPATIQIGTTNNPPPTANALIINRAIFGPDFFIAWNLILFRYVTPTSTRRHQITLPNINWSLLMDYQTYQLLDEIRFYLVFCKTYIVAYNSKTHVIWANVFIHWEFELQEFYCVAQYLKT